MKDLTALQSTLRKARHNLIKVQHEALRDRKDANADSSLQEMAYASEEAYIRLQEKISYLEVLIDEAKCLKKGTVLNDSCSDILAEIRAGRKVREGERRLRLRLPLGLPSNLLRDLDTLMPSLPMSSLALTYLAPDGRILPFTILLTGGQFWFPHAEIAQALLHDCPERVKVACDEVELKEVLLEGKRYPLKCVSQEALLDATHISRTDNGRETATGPAIHFHTWLRAVVLPILEIRPFPAAKSEVARLQRAHADEQCARWAKRAREFSIEGSAAQDDVKPLPAYARESMHVIDSSNGLSMEDLPY